ncbi:MAG: hypothetical protein HKM93_06860 [Desulfobacteraceae bacterium]|nr:hypothetical protein [Desulfobacteraceae bacterium]
MKSSPISGTKKRSLALLVAVIFGVTFFGCESTPKAPAKPKVVREKIAVDNNKKATAVPKPEEIDPVPAPVTTAQPKPTPAAVAPPQKKSVPTATVSTTPALPNISIPDDKQGTSRNIAYTYDPKGKIDPFQPLLQEKKKETIAQSKRRIKRKPTTPLEMVDLSQLKLVATLRAPSGAKALVEDATGKGYIVKKGTYIGVNAGVVLDIEMDRIIVEEEVESLLGDISIQKRELKLQKPPGE